MNKKNENQATSWKCFYVERAFSSMKRLNTLVHSFRNYNTSMEDVIFAFYAGPWNFRLLFNPHHNDPSST